MSSGRAPGLTVTYAQVSLSVRAPARRAGSRPARASEDLPLPDGPTRQQEGAGLQLFEQALDVGLAPEEEVGVLLVEGLQAAVGGTVGAAVERAVGAEGDALDRADEGLQAARALDPCAQVDPGAGREEGREPARVEGVGELGQEDEEEAEGAVGGCAAQGDPELLALPVADVVGPEEDGAGLRGGEPLGELLLPVPAGDEVPGVEPGLEAGALEVFREPLHRRLVAGVVGEEDVEARIGAGCLAHGYGAGS